MNVSCSNCDKSYELPDDRLPKGKVVSFSCPACKGRITLDLREKTGEDAPAMQDDAAPPLSDRPQPGPGGSADEAAAAAPVDQSIDELRKKIVQRIDDLPPMPKVLMKARQVMSDPASSFKDIAKIIETDQAIAAKVLKVANSAYYGLSGMVNSIHQASVVLGYKTLEELIIMASSSSMLGSELKGYNLHAGELWRHSLAVALGSRLIARKRAPSLESDAFSVGLIHDAGKLALDRYVQKKKLEIETFLKTRSPSFLEAERAILGFDHTEVAQDLCKKWKLPENHVCAMRYHHTPWETGDDQLVHIVYLANHLAGMAGMGGGQGFIDGDPISPKSLSALRLTEDEMGQMTGEVTAAVQEIIASLRV